jgi:hypothetical protein
VTVASEILALTERSTRLITKAQFRELEDSDDFLALVDRGILGLVRSREYPFGLSASFYAGEAVVGSVRVVVQAKTPGGLEALLRWSLPDDLREVAAPSLIGDGGPVLEAFIRGFLLYLGSYLRHGRLKRYTAARRTDARPRGRIDLGRTLRLRARGVVGILVYDTPLLSADLLPNRLLAIALQAADACLSVRGSESGSDLLAAARGYAPLFEDIEWRSLWGSDWIDRRAAFDEALTRLPIGGDLAAALAFARPLVLHFGAWPRRETQDQIPAAYFLRLDTLFEHAVREVLSRHCVQVAKGAQFHRQLFAEVTDRYLVEPDIVIGQPGNIQVVADCKYKVLSGGPNHDDVYQLVAHAGAFEATNAILIYPGDSASIITIGTTTAGTSVKLATVRLAELETDLRSLVPAILQAK